jgi:uncharacterized integral membrane protein
MTLAVPSLSPATKADMNSLANLAAILLVGVWMLAIAIITVQNAQPLSIEFFGQKTVAMPFGLMLTGVTVIGMVGVGLLQPLLFPSRRNRPQDEEY